VVSVVGAVQRNVTCATAQGSTRWPASHAVNVGIITETEIPSSCHEDYNVEGYHTFLPLSHSELLKTAKYRIVVEWCGQPWQRWPKYE
jgi:hypothetical protein